MAKRKMNKLERQFGIGEEEIDLDSIVVEDVNEEQFTSFAQNVDGVFLENSEFDFTEKPLEELEKEIGKQKQEDLD